MSTRDGLVRLDTAARPFACLECGLRFAFRYAREEADGQWSLESHWQVDGHGPKNVQAAGLDRASYVLDGGSETD